MGSCGEFRFQLRMGDDTLLSDGIEGFFDGLTILEGERFIVLGCLPQ